MRPFVKHYRQFMTQIVIKLIRQINVMYLNWKQCAKYIMPQITFTIIIIHLTFVAKSTNAEINLDHN